MLCCSVAFLLESRVPHGTNWASPISDSPTRSGDLTGAVTEATLLQTFGSTVRQCEAVLVFSVTTLSFYKMKHGFIKNSNNTANPRKEHDVNTRAVV